MNHDELRRRAALPRDPDINHRRRRTPDGTYRWNCNQCGEWCYPTDPCLCCRPAPDWDDVIALCDEIDALEGQMRDALTLARGWRECAERAEAAYRCKICHSWCLIEKPERLRADAVVAVDVDVCLTDKETK